MAKPMPVDQPETNGQETHPVQAGIVQEFVRILSHLSADKGCQGITSLVSDMEALKARNEKLESAMEKSSIAETENFATIQKVMNGKEEADQRCSQKDVELERAQRQASEAKEKLRLEMEKVVALKKELISTNEGVQKAMVSGKKQDLQIAGLNGKITKFQESAKQAEKDLKDAHEVGAQIKKRYEVVSQELESFRKRTFPLKRMNDSALNDQRQLKGLFDDVCHLSYHFFGQLQLESLEGVEDKWQNFTGDRALTHIPLPRSNSGEARQMRVAAVLRLISEMACNYIFQPIYLTPDGMEVAEIIDQLGSSEAEWLRSVLLNIDKKEQEGIGMERADIAAGKIIELVGFLMTSAANTQGFKNELLQWCQKASKLWMTFQELKPRIEAQLEIHVNGQGLLGWKPFPEPPLKDVHSAAGAQNGTKSKTDDKAQLVMEEIATGVWPRFLATTDDEQSGILMPGYALLKAQTEMASQELKAAAVRRGSGSHRATHGRQRAVRKVIGGANGSTERLSFLS